MKTIQCYDCDKEFKSETDKDVLKQIYKHYMNIHKEIITNASEVKKKEWMEKFNKDWANAKKS